MKSHSASSMQISVVFLLLIGPWTPGCNLFGPAESPRQICADVDRAAEVFCIKYAQSSLDEVAERWFLPADRQTVLTQFRRFFSDYAPEAGPGVPVSVAVIRATSGRSLFGVRAVTAIGFTKMKVDMLLHVQWVRVDHVWYIESATAVTRDESWRLSDPDR